MVVLVGIASVAPVAKFVSGVGWSLAVRPVLVLILAVNSTLICGWIGYLAMLILISGELHRYGFTSGLGGIRRSWLLVAIKRRREQEAHLLHPQNGDTKADDPQFC